MKPFIPNIAYFDPRSLTYPTGRNIQKKMHQLGVPIIQSRQIPIEGATSAEKYFKAKRTVYVTVNTQKKLSSCNPSADFQFALSSSCPGHCEYCYLQTTQGEKPVIKLYANIEEILALIQKHIDAKLPQVTVFECGSITDPLATEHLTGSLKKCIDFFGTSEFGRLRVITKYDDVDSLLNIDHNGHTKFRISINTDYVITQFEHNTASLKERLQAIDKIATAGYPIGFIIAPIVVYDNWEQEYSILLDNLKASLSSPQQFVTFELIQHRFTANAKNLILKRFPHTKLDLNEETRQLKWGPYGQFKHVYPKELSRKMKEHFQTIILKHFPNSQIEYFT